jgi:hypothetical protein
MLAAIDKRIAQSAAALAAAPEKSRVGLGVCFTLGDAHPSEELRLWNTHMLFYKLSPMEAATRMKAIVRYTQSTSMPAALLKS